MQTWLLVLALSGLCVGAESVPPLWRFAHPNTKSLIGMDVKRVRQSEMGRSFEQQWLPTVTGHFPGLDLLDQVDSLLISSPGAPSPDDPSAPPVLVAIRGRFDLTKVRTLLESHGAKLQRFGSVAIYRPQGQSSKEFGFALLDSSTILAGDAPSIFSAVERMRLPAGEAASAIVTRAQTLSAGSDFWAVMTAPGALATERIPFLSLAQSGLAEGVRGVELGISFEQGVVVNGALIMPAESKARELKDQLNKLFKLAAKDQASRPELALLAKNVKLGVDSSGLKISMHLPQTELSAALRPAKRLSAPVVAAKPAVIRIEGLDGGPRELPAW